MRGGRAFGNVIVTCNSQDAAPWCGARHVGMFENIGTPINARAFAIPNAKDTIKLGAAWRCKAHLLRTPQRGGCQLFVHARLKNDVVFF